MFLCCAKWVCFVFHSSSAGSSVDTETFGVNLDVAMAEIQVRQKLSAKKMSGRWANEALAMTRFICHKKRSYSFQTRKIGARATALCLTMFHREAWKHDWTWLELWYWTSHFSLSMRVKCWAGTMFFLQMFYFPPDLMSLHVWRFVSAARRSIGTDFRPLLVHKHLLSLISFKLKPEFPL